MHTMKYYLATKQNETLPFAATWMDLEIILSEVKSEREKQVSYDLVKCKKKKKKKKDTNELIYKTETDSQRMNVWLVTSRGEGREK